MPEGSNIGPEFVSIPYDPEALKRIEALRGIVEEFLDPEDAEFVADMDDEDEILNYVYGRLLAEGHDPDEVFAAAGVTEADEKDSDEV
jgi:hypothetical protein